MTLCESCMSSLFLARMARCDGKSGSCWTFPQYPTFLAKSCARDSRSNDLRFSITSWRTICATILLAIDVVLGACRCRGKFFAETLHDDFLICRLVNVALNVRVRALRARLNSNQKGDRCRSQAVLICHPRLLELMPRALDQQYCTM